MVQNSPALQDLAFRANSVPLLVHSLRDERDARTAGKHVFALSALTRGHSQALEQFVHLGGLRILRDVNPLASPVFRSSDVEAEKLDMRVVRFVEDLLSSEINPHVPVSSATTIAQFAGVWCQTLVARLVESLEDVVSDGEAMIGPVYERRLVYMHSLQQLRLAHRNTCILPPRFGAWVQDELTRIGRLDSSGMEDYRQALNDLSAKGSV
ncbi:hypothetical protein GGF43_006233 [Coemansia sp. RSA 2618]|nr:hypothetical protein GGF43_006233 [Coemansia sp. RSA 2618]